MRKNINYFLIIYTLLLGTVNAQNQGHMQTIGIPDGLSSPNIMSVYQDRFGYIWIMTEDGLNRYDGSKIKIYRNDPDVPNSLISNSVYSAVEDSDGYLWIGGIGVASRYDYATETFDEYNFNSLGQGEREQKVISLFTDSKGRIWGGTSGGTIHKLDNELGTFESINYSENINTNYTGEIWSIIELKNGKLLYANRSQGIFQYDESSGKFTSTGNPSYDSLYHSLYSGCPS